MISERGLRMANTSRNGCDEDNSIGRARCWRNSMLKSTINISLHGLKMNETMHRVDISLLRSLGKVGHRIAINISSLRDLRTEQNLRN